MKAISNALLALVRPAKGVDGMGSAIKWLWLPLSLLLIATVLFKVIATGPLMLAAEDESRQAVIAEQTKDMPEEERARFEQEIAKAEEEVDAQGIVMTATIVFGILGAVASIVLTALFFFIAAKTSANPVGFPAMLSIASLSFVPHALRNVFQTVAMLVSGTWQQHQGLSSLVAPADPAQSPGVLYGLLAQVDVWAFWALAILFGALLSKTIGFEKKKAVTTTVAFVAIAVLIKMVPVLLDMVVGSSL